MNLAPGPSNNMLKLEQTPENNYLMRQCGTAIIAFYLSIYCLPVTLTDTTSLAMASFAQNMETTVGASQTSGVIFSILHHAVMVYATTQDKYVLIAIQISSVIGSVVGSIRSLSAPALIQLQLFGYKDELAPSTKLLNSIIATMILLTSSLISLLAFQCTDDWLWLVLWVKSGVFICTGVITTVFFLLSCKKSLRHELSMWRSKLSGIFSTAHLYFALLLPFMIQELAYAVLEVPGNTTGIPVEWMEMFATGGHK
eukprot:scaffold592978_cov59-Attheya_sp.AAC.1